MVVPWTPAKLLDVSVLVALFDQSHVFHDLVYQWFTANESWKWASCAITENGLIRVGSRPGYPNIRTTPESVARDLRELKINTADRHEFWLCNISLADQVLFDLAALTSGRHSTDVFLAGLAYKHNSRFVTLDGKVNWRAVRGASADLIEVLNE